MRIVRITDTALSRVLNYCSAVIVLASSVGCASPAQERPQYTAPKDVTILSEQQLRSTVASNSISGVGTAGEKWSAFYVPDGTIRGEQDGELYKGTWEISGSMMCFDYPGTQDDECDTVAINENKVRFFNLDGSPSADYPTRTLEQGNPNNY